MKPFLIISLAVGLSGCADSTLELRRENAELRGALTTLMDADEKLQVAAKHLSDANHKLQKADEDLKAADERLSERIRTACVPPPPPLVLKGNSIYRPQENH